MNTVTLIRQSKIFIPQLLNKLIKLTTRFCDFHAGNKLLVENGIIVQKIIRTSRFPTEIIS